jgi:hypothetical protein
MYQLQLEILLKAELHLASPRVYLSYLYIQSFSASKFYQALLLIIDKVEFPDAGFYITLATRLDLAHPHKRVNLLKILETRITENRSLNCKEVAEGIAAIMLAVEVHRNNQKQFRKLIDDIWMLLYPLLIHLWRNQNLVEKMDLRSIDEFIESPVPLMAKRKRKQAV